mmetsp:Transcript_43156/g.111875  ORF Transcript_43156/g.111875 Transcript_43156/m.111875 type:complete len:100 (+) Transcript_43156:128-427(+)
MCQQRETLRVAVCVTATMQAALGGTRLKIGIRIVGVDALTAVSLDNSRAQRGTPMLLKKSSGNMQRLSISKKSVTKGRHGGGRYLQISKLTKMSQECLA